MLSQQQREAWMEFMATQHPELDPNTMRLMDELRMVSHLIYQVGENSIASADLSYAQYRILMMLYFSERAGHRTDGLNPSEISHNTGTSRNTISSLIRTLEADGLIARQLDPEDRRKFNITITQAGQKRVEDNVGRHMQTVNEIFKTLSPEEMNQLSEQLHKLNDQALKYRDQCAMAEHGGSYAVSN